MAELKRVLLMFTPWANPTYPGMSVALLRSILIREGIECDVMYSNLLFSKLTGGESLYEDQIALGQIAEVAFTPHYFGTAPQDSARTLHAYFAPYNRGCAGEAIEPYDKLMKASSAFLDRVMELVPWHQYDVVGFSLMFQQTVCSLALAKRIRAQHPDIRIVFGGPSCDAEMGEEMMARFPEIDYVVRGEADTIIAPLVREIRARRPTTSEAMSTPGVLYRSAEGEIRWSGPAQPLLNLDDIPTPDYGPYFEQMTTLGLQHFHPYLYLETARGCWWGQKHHCTFCGLDDQTIPFRPKSTERVITEVLEQSRRHRLVTFLTSDNVLGHRQYETLLPRFKSLREEEDYDLTFFYEIKSNLTRARARMLKEAGVLRVQPGIESFSDRLLKLMNKGATAIQQVQALKFLAEYGILAVWNILYMVPGEQPEDYAEMAQLIPFLHHLPPPRRQGEIQVLVQRGNPYHRDRERYGIGELRPQSFYSDIFPRADIDLRRMACFFEYDHPGRQDSALRAAHDEFRAALGAWREAYVQDALTHRSGPGFVEIRDRRGPRRAAPRRVILKGLEAELLQKCDSARTESSLLSELADHAPPEKVRTALQGLVEQRFVYRSSRREYISLPLAPDPSRWVRAGKREATGGSLRDGA